MAEVQNGQPDGLFEDPHLRETRPGLDLSGSFQPSSFNGETVLANNTMPPSELNIQSADLGHFAESHPRSKRVQLSDANDLDQNQDQPTVPVTAGVGVIEDLQMRVVKLEEQLLALRSQGTSGPIRDIPVQSSWPQADTTQSNSDFLGTLVVKGSRSRYHGQNNRVTLLNEFADAKEFINQCSSDSALVGLAKEVQFLQSKSQLAISSPESLSCLDTLPETQHLLESLPLKPLCDQLLEVYMKNFERTLRIVHIPSLLRQYEVFWDTSDPESSTPSASSFVPLLMSILTVAACFESPPPASEHSASWDDLKQNAPRLIQNWLKQLPRKKTVELFSLQVQTLHLLSSQLRLVSVEEQWKTSGALVRSAMTMGLHVNLSKATNLSFYQAEVRRRLWITIVEVDLQASIASGMPVMTPDLVLGPLTPNNLDDGDFDESTPDLPQCKPLDEETDSSSQIALANSLSQRIRVMKTAQHTNARDSLEERIKLGRELEQILHSTPSYLRPDPELGSHDPSFVLQSVILDLYLRRPLLCLYRPVINNPPTNCDDPSFHEVQRICLESSLAIISYQDQFDPDISDLDDSNLNTYWNAFGTLFQNDILLSALSICKHMRLSNQHLAIQSPSNAFSSESPAHYQMHSKASLVHAVENTLATLTRRIGEKASNMKDVLLLAVVLHTIQSNEAILPSDTQAQFTSTPQIPDLSQSSLLATEFNNFETDLFSFDDGSFMWNL
ncbi:uncharacterized protein N7443_002061 [Penicillium atrosanguineum]|uniref:uncharacterized protein n=1 Tax=Penicillium atrosanguineum TaxID=1132637 RepID=UPI002398986A|nr:uncharacterized protein N7443_002061 [Penicillium atrosanguineum]KAJ5309600.1 hypothetical protein N7443_002061 [Penicillium atrosanguineum]